MTRISDYYCKWCDTITGMYNAKGEQYTHCPRCNRKKPMPDEPEQPLDDWNRHEMENNPLELL